MLAYHAQTGKELWRHQFEPTQKAKWVYTVSRAAPTPVVDGFGIYAFFEGGDLLALSHEGKPLWSRSLVKDYGAFQNGHGLGSSPVQTENAVFVLIDDRGPSYLLAVDKRTGRNLWKVDRESRGSWTSPAIAYRAGKAEVVVSSNGSVCGYDASTGKLLWKLEGVGGNTLASASVAGDLIVVGAGAAQQKGEGPAPTRFNCCIRLVEKDGERNFEVCWNARAGLANYASPLAFQGHAYFVNQLGAVTCLDLKSGKEAYVERIDSPCWASPLGAGNLIYFFGKDGRTTVLKAGPVFEVVASNRLWDPDKPTAPTSLEDNKPHSAQAAPPSPEYLDPIVYGVAAVDGAFFLRTGTALFRIGK